MFVRAATALLVFIALIAALRGDLAHRYRKHFASERRERLFLAWVAFLATMFSLRALTWAIHNHIGPMHDVETRNFHLHHMVWGILGLLAIGYAWLAQVATGMPGQSQAVSAIMAVLYGISAALYLR